jgi:F-type H+-transporting ATPase subunit epsilon
MAALTLTLLDGSRVDRIDGVTSIVAADATGQFGLQPGHAEFVTVLEPGLFRYRTTSEPAWVFGACVGGLLSCERAAGGIGVRIVSSRILHGGEPEVLQSQLDEILQREGSLRVSTRESQLRLDLALYKRLQQLAQTHP